MSRFWCPEELVPGSEVVLSAEESHHLVHVLRLVEGDRIQLVDGRGGCAEATVLKAAAKGVRCALLTVERVAPRSRLRLCFGLAKPTATEFILRRATEVGVAAFQPLVTQHSFPASGWNEKRWEKILHEVGKQCEEPHFPTLEPPLKLATYLASRSSDRALVLCDENAREALVGELAEGAVDLLVGAEGGWHRDEVAALRSAGARLLGLGHNRLRAETAALVGAVLLKKLMGEMG